MATDVCERIMEAVARRRARNSARYEVIGLPDEQLAGDAATPEQITALEARIGKTLPASYRAFLSLYDGWSMAFGGADLLSVVDVGGSRLEERIALWRRQAVATGYTAAADAVVIGMHPASATLLWLDPADVTGGEWAVVLDHHGEEGRWESFLAWLDAQEDDGGEGEGEDWDENGNGNGD